MQVPEHVDREERRGDADGEVHEREVGREAQGPARAYAVPPVTQVHFDRRHGRGGRFVQEAQVVHGDAARQERAEEHGHEADVRVSRAREGVEDRAGRHERRERGHGREPRAPSEIAPAALLRHEVAHEARPLRRREVARGLIQGEQHEQNGDGVRREEPGQGEQRQPDQRLQARAEQDELLARHAPSGPRRDELRSRADQRGQRREQGDLRGRRPEQQRKRREIGLAGAGRDRERHAVADGVAQGAIHGRVLVEVRG